MQKKEAVMSAYETITLDATPGGIAVIILNRPDHGNALSMKMVEELSDALETLRSEVQLRMVLIRGAGEEFCVGEDRHWLELAQEYTRDEKEEDAFAMAEMLRKLHDLPQLTVALVQGSAYGLGAGMLAACDIAVALEKTAFCFNDVSRGAIPAIIAPYIMQVIGSRWAKALFLSGENFDADYAERLGLVQYVVQDEPAMEEMIEYLSGLAFANAPGAVADVKHLVSDLLGEDIDKDVSHFTAKRTAARLETAEGKEGVSAVLEDRKPSWAD